MPAKTGAHYIANLRDNPAEVWIRGERVKDVTSHPALAGGVRSVAALYDKQHDAEFREDMVYASPRPESRWDCRSRCLERWRTCCFAAR